MSEDMLEYRLGMISIDPERLSINKPESVMHRSVVTVANNTVTLHVGLTRSHPALVECFDLSVKTVVGGGLCHTELYTDGNQLVLDGASGKYYSIPQEVAEKFAELLKAKLKTQCSIDGYVAEPDTRQLNDFWTQLGYTSKQQDF